MDISAVIPAYNEEKTIGNVIKVLKQVDIISEIIVVNDGSSDDTSQEARNAGAKAIDLPSNLGKGYAMLEGVKNTNNDIILFLDADLIGLNSEHIIDLVEPILDQECDMTIGLFEKGRKLTDLAQVVAPYLSGQRAIKKEIILEMKEMESIGYGIEVALTKYVNKNKLKVKEIYLKNLTHIMKEEKLGLYKGFKARMKMYWEIAKSVSHINK